MSKMGINEEFIRWVKLLFGNTTAMVILNDKPKI